VARKAGRQAVSGDGIGSAGGLCVGDGVGHLGGEGTGWLGTVSSQPAEKGMKYWLAVRVVPVVASGNGLLVKGE
jgi:hypothetical protein